MKFQKRPQFQPQQFSPRLSKKGKVQPLYVFGKNVVDELVKSYPDFIKQIFVLEHTKDEYKKFFPKGARLQPVHISTLDKHAAGGTHQGIVVELHRFPYLTLTDLIDATKKQKKATVLALDHITDPQNFGAIIRTAAAFSCDAIIIEESKQVPVNGTVIKTSAGNAFKIPIVRVSSIQNALEELRKVDFTGYALDMGGKNIMEEGFSFEDKSVFVFGSEGEGVRKSVMVTVDEVIAIPMNADVESLNVGATAACVCFERNRQLHS